MNRSTVLPECACGERIWLEQVEDEIWRCCSCHEFFELDNFHPHEKRVRKRKIRYDENE